MDKFKNKFREEAADNINDLEEALLLIENDTNNKELVERIFRAMHSLKGGGAMFGFSLLSEFTHNLENLYHLVREDKLKINKKLLDITLASVDHLKVLLNVEDLSDPNVNAKHVDLSLQIKKLLEGDHDDTGEVSLQEDKSSTKLKSFYIYFEPNQDVFNDGTNPLFLIDELYTIGNCKVYGHLNKVPDIENIDVTKCYTYWEILISTEENVNAISDVFLFVEDQCELEIIEVANYDIISNQEIIKEISELAENRKDVGVTDVQNIVKNFEKSKQKVEQTEKSNAESPIPKSNIKENVISSIRVSSNKLDHLMNLVSELVTTQARLSLYAEQSGESELITIAENVQKLSRQLRDNAFDIVLIPIETMLTRFQRLVRDLSKELNKEVVFTAEGADTELDKTIIETLTDPLLHILRNCIDHGIEKPEIRKKLNKPEQGKILLKAFYSGANVHIQIHDDGAGMDVDKIKAKAIEKGVIKKDTVLTKKEILDLVFLPGFSTAQNVTDVSGRGVGMDVVKRKLAEVRGEVELDSEPNVGTTLTIKLPLTLSIIDGLLVTINQDYYVIPLSSVNKIHATEHSKVVNTYNNLIVIDGERIPFYYLREEFGLPEGEQEIEEIIVVSYEDKQIGLVVDQVIGEYQAVLKSLGKLYKNQEIISGATILGDGTVALVVDANKIINQFSQAKINLDKSINGGNKNEQRKPE